MLFGENPERALFSIPQCFEATAAGASAAAAAARRCRALSSNRFCLFFGGAHREVLSIGRAAREIVARFTPRARGSLQCGGGPSGESPHACPDRSRGARRSCSTQFFFALRGATASFFVVRARPPQALRQRAAIGANTIHKTGAKVPNVPMVLTGCFAPRATIA